MQEEPGNAALLPISSCQYQKQMDPVFLSLLKWQEIFMTEKKA